MSSRFCTYYLSQFGLIFYIAFFLNPVLSQSALHRFLTPSDTLNQGRAWVAGSSVFTGYTVFSIGLYKAWYEKTEQSAFHFFNDAGEWNDLDKASHVFNGYFQSSLVYSGSRWCGFSENKSILWGTGVALLFQTTVEVMDGFSTDWGFSWPDMAANVLGAGLFAVQQYTWHDQKFKLKLSAYPKSYPNELITGDHGNSITYRQRADDLYGKAYFTRFLKDYNAQTFWISFHPGMFSHSLNSSIPQYVNLSLGYGADNLYGGFSNEWNTNGEKFTVNKYPRIRQYFLSMDLDLSKIKSNNPLLRTVLRLFNFIKIPAPTLEYNSLGKFKWHWFFF